LYKPKNKKAMDYSQEAMNYLVQYQQQRIGALEDRVKFLTDELNACYQQAADSETEASVTKI
jgi:uncharacterized coiled-coil protein SlyX